MNIKNNIFLVRTPYHLAISHSIISKLNISNSRNILIVSGEFIEEFLINYKFWAEVIYFNIKKSNYLPNNIGLIERWAEDNKLNKIKNETCNIFLADDKNWLNQLLVTYFNNYSINLFEDGFGSYFQKNQNVYEYFYRNTILRLAFRKRIINYKQVSHSKADKYYAVDMSAFPWRQKEGGRLETIKINDYNYIHWLSKETIYKKSIEELNKSNLLILTQGFYESGFMSLAKDVELHGELTKNTQPGSTILIKNHPREENDFFEKRVKEISKRCRGSNVSIMKCNIPIEILISATKSSPDVVSVCSTALFNIKRVRKDINVFHLYYRLNYDPDLMKKFHDNGIHPLDEGMAT